MMTAIKPENERERLADLRALNILDTPPEQRFDRIIDLIMRMFHVPIAYIAMVDADRQWFKSRQGLCVIQTGRGESFCGHTILQDEPMIVPDATKDERFFDNPMVLDNPHIRFYAGYPLKGPNGYNVATLCMADHEPRELNQHEMDVFEELARLAESQLNMVDLIAAQRDLLETKSQLVRTQANLTRELSDASDYVESLLPPRLNRPVKTDYEFISSSKLGGDIFGYHCINQTHIAIYLLDVCGHGVAAALLSISVLNALRNGLVDVDPKDPAQVLASLNRGFPMERHQNRFFTMWYGVYDIEARTLRYATGGHPPALLFNGDPKKPAPLGSDNLIVGVEQDTIFDYREVQIEPGNRLYLFSDGAFEVNGRSGGMLRMHGLADVLGEVNGLEDGRVLAAVDRIRRFQGDENFGDDFSLLEVTFD